MGYVLIESDDGLITTKRFDKRFDARTEIRLGLMQIAGYTDQEARDYLYEYGTPDSVTYTDDKTQVVHGWQIVPMNKL